MATPNGRPDPPPMVNVPYELHPTLTYFPPIRVEFKAQRSAATAPIPGNHTDGIDQDASQDLAHEIASASPLRRRKHGIEEREASDEPPAKRRARDMVPRRVNPPRRVKEKLVLRIPSQAERRRLPEPSAPLVQAWIIDPRFNLPFGLVVKLPPMFKRTMIPVDPPLSRMTPQGSVSKPPVQAAWFVNPKFSQAPGLVIHMPPMFKSVMIPPPTYDLDD
ncbi:hypothetical protein NMY22_g266 [Coprinellus aureogranulatus]|nr:hypothetical protein NMY22_g266 [Coprinellus aureogranulatus]